MKKLMLLGGLRYLIPVIEAAKGLGCHVITCDYKPDNIAHKFSDEYHNIDILNREKVLQLAEKLNIDGVMSFAVDPGVLTAAYVCDKLKLPSAGPLSSIEILQNKAKFRNFLDMHDFNVPLAKSYNTSEKAIDELSHFDLPVMVKPVDSAGSKGVSKVNSRNELKNAIEYAIKNSPSGSFLIEEFLEAKGFSSDSDCFSVNGEFKLISFSSQRFDSNSPNPFTPSAYSWPSGISNANQNLLKSELQRLIDLLGMKTSVYNVEVREATNGKAYIMEVAPRGGGNRLSEMIKFATGVNLIRNSVLAALGEEVRMEEQLEYNGNWAELILYSNKAGIFKELIVDDSLREYLVEEDLWIKKGDRINAFTGANHAIGTLIFNFKSSSQLNEMLAQISKLIQIKV